MACNSVIISGSLRPAVTSICDADGVAAIIGSINLAPGSLDSRRELSIEVRNDEVVDRLSAVVRADWEHSRPMDLTDAGLLDDLDEIVAEGSGLLALGEAEA